MPDHAKGNREYNRFSVVYERDATYRGLAKERPAFVHAEDFQSMSIGHYRRMV